MNRSKVLFAKSLLLFERFPPSLYDVHFYIVHTDLVARQQQQNPFTSYNQTGIEHSRVAIIIIIGLLYGPDPTRPHLTGSAQVRTLTNPLNGSQRLQLYTIISLYIGLASRSISSLMLIYL